MGFFLLFKRLHHDLIPEMSSSSEAQELAQTRCRVFLDGIASKAAANDHGVSFDYTALSGLTNIRSDGPGHCAADLPVTPSICNWMGNLHGGCTGEPQTCALETMI